MTPAPDLKKIPLRRARLAVVAEIVGSIMHAKKLRNPGDLLASEAEWKVIAYVPSPKLRKSIASDVEALFGPMYPVTVAGNFLFVAIPAGEWSDK